ncbi:MAG: hypothetical protein B5766_00820 [Candidatus Lumbricidophila eiseniae]|uniref:DUF2142 domain-containing protein n=1 Tax=Candidatus Lumbricidiphila eiseniae TaxID=1969409 RepID=A0A2A6FUK3_9MICO|nr:MAG: hypothetical protein B5766_00820 [Candidatus Lumbricidophila eiseniae]
MIGEHPMSVASDSHPVTTTENRFSAEAAQPSSRRVRMIRIIAAVIAPVMLAVALGTWALASPVGSSPDEDFHLNSIWCGNGIRQGLCEAGATDQSRSVPSALHESSHCFAGKPTQTPTCLLSPYEKFVDTTRGNFNNSNEVSGSGYPTLYYAVMGLIASKHVTTSVIVMRLLNVLIYVGLITALGLLLSPARRGILLWSIPITIVPFGMFLIPSINPSGWGLISASTLWLALVGYFEADSTRRRIGFGAIALAAYAIGVGARADAGAYAVVAIVIAIILTAQRTRRFVLLSIPPLLSIIVAIVIFLQLGQNDPTARGSEPRPNSEMFLNFFRLPELWAGSFGTWGLGWLDTTLPGTVWALAFLVFAGMTFRAFGRFSRRTLLATLGTGFFLVAIPLAVLFRNHLLVGTLIQPRYLLPLLIILAGVMLFSWTGESVGLSRAQIAVVVAMLAIANTVALHVNMRRYLTGTDTISLNLNSQVEWWWAIPVSPLTVWVVGTLTFALSLAAIATLAFTDRYRRVAPPQSQGLLSEQLR